MFRLPVNPGDPWVRAGHVRDADHVTNHVTNPPPQHTKPATPEVATLVELQSLAAPETLHLLRQRISQRLNELGAGPQGPQSLLQLFDSVCGWRKVVSDDFDPIITPVTTNGSAVSAKSLVASQTSDRHSATATGISGTTAMTSKMTRLVKGKAPSTSKGYYANLDTAPGVTLAKMLSSSPEYALRESYFQKCFPMHRKQFEHATQPRSFLRSPRFKKVLISPDCTMLACVAETHWEVFKVPENFNYPPTLHCEGTMNGVYGRLSESRYPKKDRYAKEEEEKFPPPGPADLGDFEWEFNHASLSNRYLAITGTKGMVRVFDLEKFGKPIYTYRSDFNAQAIALSPSGSLLVCSITGRDLKTDAVKPMIALHNLGDLRRKMRVRRESRDDQNGSRDPGRRDSVSISRRDSRVESISSQPSSSRDLGSSRDLSSSVPSSSRDMNSREFLRDRKNSVATSASSTHSNSSSSTFGLTRGSPTTLTTPYTDPVTRIIISSQETSILCATETQSRFFVIDVQSPVEPRLIMKSARRADPSPESEGITDLAFFPNQQVVVVASLAKDSPPIVVDTNVRNLHPALPPTSVSQPSLLSRLDSLGYNIHCVAVSPRGDAMAFVDKSGLVYVVYLDPHTYAARKTVLVAEVGSAQSAYEAAALRFSADGQVLFTVDYKGVCHIQDWGAGNPNHAGVGKCQTLRANKS
ncbi:SPS-sensor component PTR3 [Yarrowia sp. B02]|nr:SPS-sensor component PTR3 [Yarrowia sp. B02]